jgi:LuxR family transcriptional regulator, maltose regulon positive regulatory protein
MLLATKLFIPQRFSTGPQRPFLIPRPHLHPKLRAGLENRLILVSAPTGFGKTTLLADWIRSNDELGRMKDEAGELHPSSFIPHHFCWLSLDEGDNDPALFLGYLIAALQTAAPALGQTAVHLLQSLPPPMPEVVLTAVINELTAVTEPIVLVLDDYHAITAPAIHAALIFLVAHQPPNLHLVITSRADPPLPLARWRARREMAELRAADLRFTVDETAVFLNDVMGLNLTAADIAALEERTEGWIAGLQLAALALHEQADTAAFIQSFSGSHAYILDYLLDEVLERQPPVTRDFLLQTAVLDRLCGPLCDALTGQSGSQMMLEQMAHANLFILPLDNEQRWFRYHRLFADVLRHRLRQESPALWPELYHRAAVWHEQQGLIPAAIQYALAGDDLEQAVALIEPVILPTVLSGQLVTAEGWLNALPEDAIRANPSLASGRATTLMLTNRLLEAEPYLQAVEQAAGQSMIPEQRRTIMGWATAIRGQMADYQGDLTAAVNLSRQALALLPQTMSSVRAGILGNIAHAYLVSGDVTPASEQQVREQILLAREAGNLFARLHSMTRLADLQMLQGRLRQAADAYARASDMVPQLVDDLALSGSAAYFFGLAALRYEQNELETAVRLLAQGMAALAGPLTIEAHAAATGYITLARLKQAQGDGDGALALLAEFKELAQQQGFFSLMWDRAAAVQAQLQLRHGYLAAAGQWAAACYPRHHDLAHLPYLRETEYLVLVRVLTAQGQAPAADRLLARLLAAAEAAERRHSVIEILILQSLSLQSQHKTAGALLVLQQALGLAEPEGYVRTFLDEGPPLAVLLRHIQARSAYARRLLAAFPAAEQAVAAQLAPAEILSAREREVLRLVAQGASNQTIAATLVVSIPTAKKHVSNILSKLHAASRTQAVAQARELGLL